MKHHLLEQPHHHQLEGPSLRRSVFARRNPPSNATILFYFSKALATRVGNGMDTVEVRETFTAMVESLESGLREMVWLSFLFFEHAQ